MDYSLLEPIKRKPLEKLRPVIPIKGSASLRQQDLRRNHRSSLLKAVPVEESRFIVQLSHSLRRISKLGPTVSALLHPTLLLRVGTQFSELDSDSDELLGD